MSRRLVGATLMTLGEDEESLAARAAWMHYAGSLTQAQVAKRLGISSLKAHRLISKANQDGLVKVYIDADINGCLRLEESLSALYDLEYCQVIPDFDQDPLQSKALGIAGAHFLKREIARPETKLIGVGYGRALVSAISYLPHSQQARVRFVSLMGGLTRKFSANPHDVIHRLAERTGAEAYFMPVPFLANRAEDRSIFLAQPGIRDVFNLAKQADLLFVGIGTLEREASLVETGMITPAEIEALKANGGQGEILGHFFDGEGNPVETDLSERILTLPRSDLCDRRIIAIAGGIIKIAAILSVLKSRYLKGLITDEKTALVLVEKSNASQSIG